MGKFNGKVRTEWLDDGRTMKLLSTLKYVDNDGKTWYAHSGTEIDGASIPRFLWRVIGSPFVGKFRDASVVHDAYCKDASKPKPWNEVHKCFNEMMEASGVSKIRRYLMFKAVWYFGPRW